MSAGRARARTGDLLYHRPSFSGDYRLLHDLTQYAPGLNTSFADIQAVLEAEAKLTGTAIGYVDPEARKLIERARAAGWQSVSYPGKDGAPGFAITVNGAGQFVYERTLMFGLRERVVCDGAKLLHLYDEIGLGARRSVSRFHRAELAQLVPWFVPAANDLARGADVKRVDETTVAIIPHGQTAKGADGKPLLVVHAHLIFGADGTLSERRIVEQPAGKVLTRETYDRDTVAWIGGDGKTVSTQTLEVRPAPAPNLRPDIAKLVLVPMPLRTTQHILNTVSGGKVDTYFTKWKEEDAIALLASQCFGPQNNLAGRVFSERFHSQGDHRLGFYVLFLASGQHQLAGFNYRFERTEGTVDVLAEHPRSPLAKLLVHIDRSNKNGWMAPLGEFGAREDSFLGRFARCRDLYLTWNNAPNLGNETLPARLDKATAYLKECPSPALAWGLVEAMQRRANGARAEVQTKLAAAFAALKDRPGLEFYARYEEARALRFAGKHDESAKAFRALYQDEIKAGRLPLVDADFREALGGARPFADFIHETAKDLIKQTRPSTLLLLTWQMQQLADSSLALKLLDRALAATRDAEHRLVLVAALEFCQRHQPARFETLLKEALADEELARRPALWRLAAQNAQGRKGLARSVVCLEKAMDLEFHDLPAVVNLQTVRNDYQSLLSQYQQLAQALTMLDMPAPKDFVAKVVRAADRWRALDPEATQACQLAAQILQTLGGREATDLAWEYLTTPIAHKPNEAAPWVGLANALRSGGNVDLIDRAYAAAFAAEPTNAQILWDRAQNLMQFGRGEQARALLEQLANGEWQERFQPLRQQARGQLNIR